MASRRRMMISAGRRTHFAVDTIPLQTPNINPIKKNLCNPMVALLGKARMWLVDDRLP